MNGDNFITIDNFSTKLTRKLLFKNIENPSSKV